VSTFASLDPQVRPWAEWFVGLLREAGLNPIVTSSRRSAATQRRLYADYLAGRNPYPVARPGTSRHELGQAFDMVVPYVEIIGPLWNRVIPGRTKWGGKADPVHFELRLPRK